MKARAIDIKAAFVYHPPMIEIAFLISGLAFSMMVYYMTIRPRDLRPVVKALYFSVTSFGITGMLFLMGIMVSHVLSGR